MLEFNLCSVASLGCFTLIVLCFKEPCALLLVLGGWKSWWARMDGVLELADLHLDACILVTAVSCMGTTAQGLVFILCLPRK